MLLVGHWNAFSGLCVLDLSLCRAIMLRKSPECRLRCWRLLVVTPWFPNRPGDWPFPFVAESCLALAEIGLEVDVVVARPWTPSWLARLSSVKTSATVDQAAFPTLASVSLVRYPAIPRGHLRHLGNRLLDVVISRTLQRIASVRRPLAVLLHTEGLAPASVATCRRLGLPVVVTIHGLNTDPHFLFTPAQKARLAKALLDASRVVLVGEPLRAFFAEYVGRDDHFRVVPNGVTIPPFEPMQVFTGSGDVRLMSVSNLLEGKGIDVTLRALSRLREDGLLCWTYRIVGEGRERPALEALVRTLGLADRVTFAGAVRHAAVNGELSEADVFVLPSFREAFGIAYLEAMAAGLLTIGVEGQGPSHFIRHGETGLLVPPQDVNALAAMLRMVLTSDRQRWQTIALAGSASARREWSWEVHAHKLAAVLREAIEDQRS